MRPYHPLWSAAVKNMLAVAFIVLVASVALSQNVPPREGPPTFIGMKGQRWEYKVTPRGALDATAMEKKLNDLAPDGWELDAIDEGNYILRRPSPREFMKEMREQVGPRTPN